MTNNTVRNGLLITGVVLAALSLASCEGAPDGVVPTATALPTATPTPEVWDQAGDNTYTAPDMNAYINRFMVGFRQDLKHPTGCLDRDEFDYDQLDELGIPQEYHDEVFKAADDATIERLGISGTCYAFIPYHTDLGEALDDIQAFNALKQGTFDSVNELCGHPSEYHSFENYQVNWLQKCGYTEEFGDLLKVSILLNTPFTEDDDQFNALHWTMQSYIVKIAEEIIEGE